MKPTTINVQITKNPKQYEAVRIGMEATLEPNETVENAIKAATAQLNAIYAEMYTGAPKVAQNAKNEAKNEPQQATQEPAQRELLKFGDKRVQQIVSRIEKNPDKSEETLEKARKYYEFDEQAEKAVTLAVELNKKLNKNN